MEELVGFLKHAQANVRQQAATHVHRLTASPDGLEALKSCQQLVPTLARLTGDVQSIAQSALCALINLAEVQEVVGDFEKCAIVDRLAENLHQEGYALMQLDIILLANLTARSEKIVNDLLAARGGATLLSLVSALKDDVKGEHESLDCVTNIITNVARYQPGRVFLQNKQKDLLKGLLEQIDSDEPGRRRGMLLFLSNLLFNRDMIAYLTAPGLDYANRILTMVTASESKVKVNGGDVESLNTILTTLCTLAANVRGKNELARIKALERIRGIDITTLPDSGDVREHLQEVVDVLEGKKTALQPGGAGPVEGRLVALDREKMAADGVEFVDGSLVKTGGGAEASVSDSAANIPPATGDQATEGLANLDIHDDDDSDGEDAMGMD
eukprot:INCI17640.4.p2 GENE.INCI17640.4~~INCI17640.4.p2  ORF type:complete len:411 (+),score=121.16 INCI17640.4:80-1234(+)